VVVEISQFWITHLITLDDFEDAESDGTTTRRTTRVESEVFVSDANGVPDGDLVVLQVVKGHDPTC
jgi:hypothetical protein